MSQFVLDVVNGKYEEVTQEQRDQFEREYRAQLENGFYIARNKEGLAKWSNKYPEKAQNQLEQLPVFMVTGFNRA